MGDSLLNKSTMETSEKVRFCFFIIVSIGTILPLAHFYLYGSIPSYWLQEDGIYESLGALSAFIGSGLAFYAYHLSGTKFKNNGEAQRRNIWLILFALVLFFLGAEEISWGQRLLDFNVSQELSDGNFQGEFNLHNSKSIQSSNSLLSELLARLLVVYLILFPMFLAAFPSVDKLARHLRIPTPTIDIALVALLAKMMSTITLRAIHGETMPDDVQRLGEMFESILEICLFWAAAMYLYNVKRTGDC
jgi:hypothetical protein